MLAELQENPTDSHESVLGEPLVNHLHRSLDATLAEVLERTEWTLGAIVAKQDAAIKTLTMRMIAVESARTETTRTTETITLASRYTYGGLSGGQ